MFNYIWPIALVVISNTIYQICAKSVSGDINPFASLTITYLIAAVMSGIMFFTLNRGVNIVSEYKKLNWAPFVLGLVIIGLEVGFIYAYKVGWQVGTAQIVSSSFLAILLIIVGTLLYKETLTWNKVVGLIVCMVGLFFINFK